MHLQTLCSVCLVSSGESREHCSGPDRGSLRHQQRPRCKGKTGVHRWGSHTLRHELLICEYELTHWFYWLIKVIHIQFAQTPQTHHNCNEAQKNQNVCFVVNYTSFTIRWRHLTTWWEWASCLCTCSKRYVIFYLYFYSVCVYGTNTE